MPGFETIVRPVVFPNIRPVPTRSLPPEDDPEKGKCEIGGGGGGIIAVTENISVSGSVHNPKETERRVDKARVFQKNDDGSVNRENFIDIDVANKIEMESDIGTTQSERDSDVDTVGNRDAALNSDRGKMYQNYYYAPIKEADNIEITKRNVIKKEPATKEGSSE